MRTQGTQLVAQFLGQHRYRAVYQINAGAALAGFLVDRRARLHIVGDIRDVDAHLVVAVAQFLERQGVVEVLGIRRIYRERESAPVVLAALEVGRRNLFRNAVGCILHLLFELVWQIEFRQDGVHLGIVLAGHAQHVCYVADGRGISTIPAVHYNRHLHPSLGAEPGPFFGIHLYVVGHVLALHQHPGLGPDGVVDAHELLAAALHYLYHLALALALGPSAGLRGRLCSTLLGNRHLHGVAVQRIACLGRFHINVVLLSVHDHEDEPFAGHLHATFIYRITLLLPAGTLPAAAGTIPALISAFCHNAQIYYNFPVFCGGQPSYCVL